MIGLPNEESVNLEHEGPRADTSCAGIDLSIMSAPDFPESFPGAPLVDMVTSEPSADTYAFYLPYHLYKDRGWGIYLLAERVERLARDFCSKAGGQLSLEQCIIATRLYLYEHAFFHHKAESFSTRFEVYFRAPIYLQGQRIIYEKYEGTDDLLEEALAEAYALRRVPDHLKKNWNWSTEDSRLFVDLLERLVKASGPGYRRGVNLVADEDFHAERNHFAEQIHAQSPIAVLGRPPEIWEASPHAFRGLANALSNVKYIVHSKRSGSTRKPLELRPQ